jgi:hypothetical protein
MRGATNRFNLLTTKRREVRKKMKQGPFRDDGFQHYYLRDDNNDPYGVVVIGPSDEDGKIHRGISLCSHLDQWDRVEGRHKAVGRIRKAIGTEKCSEDVASDARPVVNAFLLLTGNDYIQEPPPGCTAVFKSAYNATPTEKEVVIIENLLKKQAEAVEEACSDG